MRDRGLNSLLVLAFLGLLAVILAVALTPAREEGLPAPAPSASEEPPPPPETAAPPVRPSFDVVRIGPGGSAVIAGRADPGAEVVIRDGEAEIGRVIADRRGEWVFVPDDPLPPGARILALRARNADGGVTGSEAPVALVVPDREGPDTPAIALDLAPGGKGLLQPPPAPAGAPEMSIDVATRLGDSGLYLFGRAPLGARLHVYFDDRLLGRSLTDAQGRWRLAAEVTVRPGDHRLRADHVAVDGKVRARVEVTLDVRLAGSPGVVAEDGGRRWRIGAPPGSGYPDATVFRAGPEQIRDPGQVYPGQVEAAPAR